ncbi:MAG: IS21 family transposase [candidate division Zixibacteria bacterium]|nr:IS21 family transposase [candidate division Zixibacteria bacterium]
MRKVREILRLGLKCGIGRRQIARSCGVSHPTVSKYLRAAEKAEMKYKDIEEMDNRQLKGLIRKTTIVTKRIPRAQPDWAYIHQELKRKGVTLTLLWQEYKEIYPQGYQSTQFCEHYYNWRKTIKLSLRQTYKAGEKMFVDYTGQTINIQDRLSGKIFPASIFVVTLGASNYTYAEAQTSQSLPNWIEGHIRAFEYFGGVTRTVIPDNLKSGVTKICRYEPDINPTYNDLAAYYGTAIIPARASKPQDKAKVETGVQIVSRWILARLRKRTFFSIGELNQAIRELLKELNDKPFQKLPGSRLSTFTEIERTSLLPLPQHRYQFAQWKKAKVNIDYHVELFVHYYSVPYSLVHHRIEIRYTNTIVEIFYKGKRITSHRRNDSKGQHTTIREHMPESHRRYLEWSPSRIINWAKQTGVSTAEMVETIIKLRQHPEQGYRSCLGILRLGKKYSMQRLESACTRALSFKAYSYKSVRSILEKGLEKKPLPQSYEYPAITHENIRGTEYFHNQKEVDLC